MELSFSDPHVERTEAFDVGAHRVIAPVFTEADLSETLASVDRGGEEYFGRDADGLEAISRAVRAWADPDNALRKEALPAMSGLTGFSVPTILCFGLQALAEVRIRPDVLHELPGRVRTLVETAEHGRYTPWADGYLRGYGVPEVVEHARPRRVLHILAGNVVGPSWLISVVGALCRTPQIVKAPRGDIASYMYFLRSLADADEGFRRTIACGYSPGGGVVNDRLYAECDVVVAMGSDASLRAIRTSMSRINPGATLVPHGNKIGFQVVGREHATPEVAELTAWAIAAHDGNACFVPANVYVETGGPLDPAAYAEAVAGHLEAICGSVPPKRTLEAAQTVKAYRQEVVKRRLLGEDVRVIGPRGADYTVVVDGARPELTPTCQERTVVVKPIASVREVLRHVGHLSGNLETAGVAVPQQGLLELAEALGAAGVTNIKAVGSEHLMDLADPHDGLFNTVQPTLSDGLRWTALHFRDMEQALEQTAQRKKACLDLLG